MIETMTLWYRIRLIGARRLFFLLLLLVIGEVTFAQLGCTDPQAINYDATATASDGSCMYPPTSVVPTEIGTLPTNLNECSGFVRYNDDFLAINDSESGPDIHLLDQNDFSELQKLEVNGAVNIDWEEITTDESLLYIGDFGNISGDRTDLRIYRVPLTTVTVNPSVQDTIRFSYEDQISFEPEFISTPFDCEAMVVAGDSIHLFTKGWSNNFTKHYRLLNQPGNQVAQLVDSFYMAGLITGATMASDSILLLTGYGVQSFCWIVKDYHERNFFSGNKRNIGLGSLGQNETVTYLEDGNVLITNEAGFVNGKVNQFNFLDFVTSATKSLAISSVKIYPNPMNEYVYLELNEHSNSELTIYDVLGRLYLRRQINSDIRLSTNDLPIGTYFLRLKNDEGAIVHQLLKIN